MCVLWNIGIVLLFLWPSFFFFQLSKPTDIPTNAYNIFDIVLCQIVVEYVDYAVELALQAVPIPESRSTPPQIYFFCVVNQANSIIHLVEKNFIDNLLPLVV